MVHPAYSFVFVVPAALVVGPFQLSFVRKDEITTQTLISNS